MSDLVLVGVDASAHARAALAWARTYADQVGADVVAVHALGLLERDPTGALESSQHHRAEIAARYAEQTGDVPCVLRDGAPAAALLAEAKERGANLLVVGTRGEGGASLLGSTSALLAQQSDCPVVIVPTA